MSKRVADQINSFKYKGEPIKITLGTVTMTVLCVILLIVATFTQITVHHPYIPSDALWFLGQEHTQIEVIKHFIKSYDYIPQIPMIFFIVALMGRKFGIIAIVLYILLGMFFPIFALGGGISYLFEYGFGYILAYLPSVFFAGTLLKGKTDYLRIPVISLVGVITIHILGILYMLFISTLRHAPWELVTSWISSQSGVQMLYDIFFTIIAVILGKQLRRIFWIVMC